MYRNGFTRKTVIETVRKNNKGYKSYDGSECMYRADDGNCCLVGCFIPDSQYNREMESKDAVSIIGEFSLEKHMPMSTIIMDELQTLHDNSLDSIDPANHELFYTAIENWLIDREKPLHARS